MFYREEKKIKPLRRKSIKNLESVETHEILLQDKKRQELLLQIHKNLALSASEHKKIAQPLLETIACFYQQLPETSLYYGQRGGLLDHALHRTEAALQLMHQLLRKDSEAPSEKQSIWLYAVFSAGLIRGAGKLYSEYKVSIYNETEDFVQLWRPVHDNMNAIGAFYTHEFTQDIDETGRRHITVLLAKRLMPEKGLALITAHPDIFYAWLALLEEDKDGAGALSAILDRADAIALQRYLLKYAEEHKHLLDQAPGRMGTFMDTTPESTVDRERVLGAEFLLWVRDSLADGKLLLNKPPLNAFISPNGVVLSSETFDKFMQEHLKFKNKYALQRAVRTWQQHSLSATPPNDDFQLVTQMTLDNALLPETVTVFSAKTDDVTSVRALDLIHDLPAYSLEHDRAPTPVRQLNEHGQWVTAEDAPAQMTLGMGFKPRG